MERSITNMENSLLNSGGTVQQTTQPENSNSIFIHSRTYGPKPAPDSGSNMKFYSRKCDVAATGVQLATEHMEHVNGQDVVLGSSDDVYNVQAWSEYQPRYQQQQQQQQQQQPQQLQQQQQKQQLQQQQQKLQEHNLKLAQQQYRQLEQQQQQQQQQHFQQLATLQQRHQLVAASASSHTRSHCLNVSAPSFTPASARCGSGAGDNGLTARRMAIHLMSTQSQSELQAKSQSTAVSQAARSSASLGRRSPMPDLFQTVLTLMKELNRSVSYPEIISMLSIRLQRLPVELKRHIPHTLHGAVANGYLRKDGNYYTLLSDQEQKEIMMRNQEAAKRAKELEKEPLSWRLR